MTTRELDAYELDLNDRVAVRNHMQSLFDVGHLWERTCSVEEEISKLLADLYKAGWSEDMVTYMIEGAAEYSHFGFRNLQMGKLVARYRL